MSEYDNTLRGALFINDDKRSPNHPDYKGSCETEDGAEYWVSAWIKEIRSGKNAGNKFLSLAFTPKDDNTQQRQATNRPASTDADNFLSQNRAKIDKHKTSAPIRPAPQPVDDSFDDDIPF